MDTIEKIVDNINFDDSSVISKEGRKEGKKKRSQAIMNDCMIGIAIKMLLK